MCTYCGTTNYRKIYKNHVGPIPQEEDGRTYEIHHIDGNHSNNNPSNLIAVTLNEHYNIHYAQGDYNACKLMKLQRMNYTTKEIQELSRKGSLGKASVIDQFGNKFKVPINDPRLLSGELVGVTKGRSIVKDNSGKILSVDKFDSRILSGELVGVTKGFMVAKDKNGKTMQVSVNDTRLLSGELVSIVHGTTPVWVGKKKKCLYCADEFDSGNYTRYHGEKCPTKLGLPAPNFRKYKNRVRIKEKKVIIDGTIYKSLTDASRILSLNISTIYHRLRNDNFTNYHYYL